MIMRYIRQLLCGWFHETRIEGDPQRGQVAVCAVCGAYYEVED